MIAADLRLERLLHRRQRRLGFEPQVLGHRRPSAGVVRSPPKVAMTRPAAWPVARSVIAGRPAPGCSALKRRATGPICSGRNQQPVIRRLHDNRHEDRCVRPVHRPGRLRREQRPALRQGRRGGHRRQVRVIVRDRHRRSSPPARQRQPAGVAWSASASNTASPRTGRLRSSTITSVHGQPQLRPSRDTASGVPVGTSRDRPHPPGRRSRHRPRQLSLGWPGHREVLMLRDFAESFEKAGLAPAFLFVLGTPAHPQPSAQALLPPGAGFC